MAGSQNALLPSSHSSTGHYRLRIIRMTSKPLIVAEAVGRVLNPRAGFISRLSTP